MTASPQELAACLANVSKPCTDWVPDTPSSHSQSGKNSRAMTPPNTLVDLATPPATSNAGWLSPVLENPSWGKHAPLASPQTTPALSAVSTLGALSPKSVPALPLPVPNSMPSTTSASCLLPDPLAPVPSALEPSSTLLNNPTEQDNQMLNVLLGQAQSNNVAPAATDLTSNSQAPIPPASLTMTPFSSPKSTQAMANSVVSPLAAPTSTQANDEVIGPWQESLATDSPLNSVTQPPSTTPTMATATEEALKPMVEQAISLGLDGSAPPVTVPQTGVDLSPLNFMWPGSMPSTQPPSLVDASSLESESSVLESPPSVLQEPPHPRTKQDSKPPKQYARTKKSSSRGRIATKRNGDPAVTRFPCPECGKEFNRHYNLVAHKVMHDPNHPRPFICPATTCKKAFARKYDACRHYRQLHISRDGCPPEWIERIVDTRRVQPTTA